MRLLEFVFRRCCYHGLFSVCGELCLERIWKETKYMVMSGDQNACEITVEKLIVAPLKRWKEFIYLETTLTVQNSIQEEINSTFKSRNT